MLRLMLDSHSRISCGPETRFLEDLERLVGEDWKRLSQFGFSQDEWLARLRAFFGGIQRDYAQGRGKVRWADKSPRYALHIPFLAQLFPDAQFVHVIRDGRDVAVSHRKRFGYWSSVKSSVKWPKYIHAAQSAGATLPPGRYYELRYDRLVADPETSIRDLLAWLGEDWEPQILDFAKAKHDVPARYHRQLAARQQKAGTKESVYASRVGTWRKELDPVVRSLFWVTSRKTLRQLGY